MSGFKQTLQIYRSDDEQTINKPGVFVMKKNVVWRNQIILGYKLCSE